MKGITVVTGAAGTLGQAVVARLAGPTRTIAAVDLGAVPDAPDVLGLGGVDLTDEAAVADCFARIAGHGQIAGLVTVAGGFTWERIADGKATSFDRMYGMNLKTAAIACISAVPHLADDAAIVTIAAAATARPGTGMAAYAASKAGVIALTESLAEELRGRARVNAVLPTMIDTPANRADMPDVDPADFVPPAEIAELIAFLLSPAAACVTGATIRTR